MRSRKLLAWRPASPEDEEWIRGEADRQGRGALGRLLDEALKLLRKHHEQEEAP